MPIVGEGNNVHVEYKIPEEIKSRIPDYFYYAMAGELVSIFGPYILKKFESQYDLDSGTGGWYEAFAMTCRKLNMAWLVEYWGNLPSYDSDIFDGLIEQEIIKRFCEKDHLQDHANCYYKYLVNLGNS